jgi:CRP-like cAMP-binding protein
VSEHSFPFVGRASSAALPLFSGLMRLTEKALSPTKRLHDIKMDHIQSRGIPAISAHTDSSAHTRSSRAVFGRTDDGRHDPSNAIIKGLSLAPRKAITPYIHRVFLRKHEYLQHQGVTIDTVYFPETAVVSEFHVLDDGRMIEVAMTGRGGAVGIAGIFQPDHRSPNSAEVLIEGSVLKIDAAVIRKVVQTYPDALSSVSSSLSNYIRRLSQNSVCSTFHPASERFCTWLLRLEAICGPRSLKLTQEQIAKALGVYRPSVTGIAVELKRSGIIDYSRGEITILNRQMLESSACSCDRSA